MTTEYPHNRPVGRRVVVREYGETPLDAIEHHLAIEPQPPPDPAALKPTDVVIAVESASVAWVDLLMTSGQYQHMAPPPYTPGMEYSGTVAWVGPEVPPDRARVGDRVIADGAVTGPRSKGDYQRYGGFASYAVAPAEAVLALPEGFTFDQGCCFLGNYETAYHCLVTRGKLHAGESVLILGASGATGLAAVHVAKLLGATVLAAGRAPAKLEAVRAHGADHVVCTQPEGAGAGESDAARGVRRFRDEVKALTHGRGVDVVYDAVGGELSVEALHSAAFGARFLIVGWASTPFVARGKGQRGAPNANQLPTNLVMMKGLDVLGCPMVIATQHDPSLRVKRLADLWSWVRAGRIAPHVGRVFPLSDVRAAMRARWASDLVGSCVVHPSE